MQRINQVNPADAPANVKPTLDAVKTKLGMVPNIFKTMAQSPAVLNGYLALSGSFAEGKLSAALREQIALVTAGHSGCNYCASAHSALGKMAGLEADEMQRNLSGNASDAKTQAALAFASKLVVNRGHVSDADINSVKAAGYSEEEMLEIFGNVAANLFTNYFNHLAGTEIDFPRVDAIAEAA